MTTVAILGTGKMGGAMARRLASSGFDVTVWNRTPARAEELHVGRVAATPVEAVRDADVIISSLTNDAAVRDVYLGEGGVLRSAAGKLLIDASTAGPQIAEELGREAQSAGARLLEAPVVGSVPAVESGKLLILAGGDRADLELARPVLEKLGEVVYVGERAQAQRLKLVANSMLAITAAAAAELLAAGTALGLDREQVFAILVRFAPGLAVRERGFLHDQHTPTMFAVRDLVKDLDLGLGAFGGAGAATPLTREARERFAGAMLDSADLDITAVGRRPAMMPSALPAAGASHRRVGG
jgi:3-hydroxyisobutyrate dehydrogenase-like beta-hydroxyacid dehydrogenase